MLEEQGSAWYLVDCGEGTQHQLLRAPMSLMNLQAAFITHVHGDHCYGLPGLLASAGMLGRSLPLHIIAPVGIEAWIRATVQLTQLVLPYELRFVATEALEKWTYGNWVVEKTPLSHRVPSFAYTFTEAGTEPKLDTGKLEAHGIPRGPAWGQLRNGMDVTYAGRTLKSSDYICFPHAPKRVVVAGDNDRPELLREACRGAHVLVHEATFTKEIAEGPAKDFGHSSAASVASFAQSAGVPNLILTHFSPRYQADASRSPSIEDLRKEAAGNYDGKLFLAEDLARYRLSRSGELSRTG